ncbi:hypothetical protein HMPREF9441_00833 [Paraprevotella clara YIT 11840]|uniref:Uncharacterized protein n=1 Tax=Paraprevotella clara YIT 11840 TaxID=762968 RepID=G5SNA4_9BACT|nr:hypothetical protein HMPREF9441_00833 [Paraprevotella clara YIT 11840]
MKGKGKKRRLFLIVGQPPFLFRLSVSIGGRRAVGCQNPLYLLAFM